MPPSLKSTNKQPAATSATATTTAEISSSSPPPFVQSKPPPSPPAPSPLALPQPEPVQVEVTAAAEADAHPEEEDSKEEEVRRDKPDSEVSHFYFLRLFLMHFFDNLLLWIIPSSCCSTHKCHHLCVEPISAQGKAVKRADYLLFITSKY